MPKKRDRTRPRQSDECNNWDGDKRHAMTLNFLGRQKRDRTVLFSEFLGPWKQGGVKSTPSSPWLRVGVILTDPEPAKEALWFSYSDSFQLNQLRLWEWEAVRVKYQGSRGHSASKCSQTSLAFFQLLSTAVWANTDCHSWESSPKGKLECLTEPTLELSPQAIPS